MFSGRVTVPSGFEFFPAPTSRRYLQRDHSLECDPTACSDAGKTLVYASTNVNS